MLNQDPSPTTQDFLNPQQAFEHIRELAEAGSLANALPFAREAVDAFPEDARLRAYLADCLLWTGKLEEGETESKNALTQAPNDAFVLSCAADVAAYAGRLEDAYALIQRALEINAHEHLVLIKAANVFALVGEIDRALDAASQALEVFPNSVGTIYACASMFQLMHETDQYNRAVQILKTRFPDHADTYITLSRLAMQEKDLGGAEQRARYAVAAAPNNSNAWMTLGQTLVFQDKLDEAVTAAQNALEINSRNSNAFMVLANVAKRRGDTISSARYTKLATDAVPALSANRHLYAATALLRAGRKEQALEMFRKAEAECTPMLKQVPRNISLGLLAELGQWEELKSKLGTFGENERKDQWYAASAKLLEYEGRGEEAIELLRARVSSVPHDFTSQSELLRLLGTHRPSELDAEITRTLEMPLGWGAEAATLVNALLAINRVSAARQLFDKADRQFRSPRILKLTEINLLIAEGRKGEAMLKARAVRDEFRILPRMSPWKFAKLLAKAAWKRMRKK